MMNPSNSVAVIDVRNASLLLVAWSAMMFSVFWMSGSTCGVCDNLNILSNSKVTSLIVGWFLPSKFKHLFTILTTTSSF